MGGEFFRGEKTYGTPLVAATMWQGCKYVAGATDKQTNKLINRQTDRQTDITVA